MTTTTTRISALPARVPALFIVGLLGLQLAILLASIEFPVEVFVALLGPGAFYYLLKNTFAGLCAFVWNVFKILVPSRNPMKALKGFDIIHTADPQYSFSYQAALAK